MLSLILAVVVAAAPGDEPLDGLDRAIIIETSKKVAVANKDVDNHTRRVAVAGALLARPEIVDPEDREWARKVVEWSCKKYDHAEAPAPPVYYYLPQAPTYYQSWTSGGCVGGSCPR